MEDIWSIYEVSDPNRLDPTRLALALEKAVEQGEKDRAAFGLHRLLSISTKGPLKSMPKGLVGSLSGRVSRGHATANTIKGIPKKKPTAKTTAKTTPVSAKQGKATIKKSLSSSKSSSSHSRGLLRL
jgi:hypothetical protein